MSEVKNVTYGKPRVGGSAFAAKLGTALPKDASSPLAGDFKNLGYISEDGVTNKNTPSSDKVKAWGGQVVLVTQTDKEDTYIFRLIEAMNIDVLKQVYGEKNVTGDLTKPGGIKISANPEELEEHVYVFDMILKGGILKRVVIPIAKVDEIGEIKYVDNDAVGYELTVQALPDSDGNTHYEYIEDPKVKA